MLDTTMKKTLIHIGSKELISFPSMGIVDVPAKVDTGADFSAVWASDIQEIDGRLSFSLFGPGSKFYSGKAILTDDFGITQVKNSFGHVEQRYKVKLPVVLGKKKLKVEFRLADRSNNRYPVLIGKKTLLNRFLVDVSVNNALSESVRRILILNVTPSDSIKRFVDKLNAADSKLNCDFLTYDDIAITIDNEDGITLANILTGEKLNTYDAVYFKTYFKKSEIAAVVAEYLLAQGIPFFDEEVAAHQARTKLTQYARLAKVNVPVPKSIVVSYRHLANQFDRYSDELGLPFVIKDIAAERGESNYLVSSKREFDEVVKQAIKEKSYFVGQQYIENDGDYRIIILGKDIEMAIRRRKTDSSTHINNTSRGGKATLVNTDDLPAAMQAIAVRAALALNRQVAGVDILQGAGDGDGGGDDEWYVLEVNNSPQLAGGAFLDEKAKVFTKFLRKQAEK